MSSENPPSVIGGLSDYQMPLAVMHCFDGDVICEEEAMALLRGMYKELVMKPNIRWNFLCAMMFNPFDVLGLRSKGGQ